MNNLEFEILPHILTVCKAEKISDIDLKRELSLVCKTEDTPENTIEKNDGWRGFRIKGVLDFSLTGILSKLSGILAAHEISIFAVSTYNTDYILVREENFDRALKVLGDGRYYEK
jgi:hypothetical protein